MQPRLSADSVLYAAKLADKLKGGKGQEGRHRMNAIIELEGDVPVEVHLWGRFEKSELRRRYLTDEMFDELEKGLVSETGQYIANPFLSIQR